MMNEVRAARACFAIAAALLLAGPAAANYSAAELAAGGLELVKTDAITMQREDLALSPSEVRVRYEMRNDTGQPVTLRVAFPMPEVPRMTPGGMTTGPDDGNGPNNIALRPPTDPNFLNFRVRSNGQEIKPEVEIPRRCPTARYRRRAARDRRPAIGAAARPVRRGRHAPPRRGDHQAPGARCLREARR